MMNIDQIIMKPITTPAYPDSTEARRYIDDPDDRQGYDYLFVEDATWNALGEIARERGRTIDELCVSIIRSHDDLDKDFAPAARSDVMRHIKQIPDNIELPANFRVLTELLSRLRAQ
jgi:predicted DNA-binding ribbon-helix-helix protein